MADIESISHSGMVAPDTRAVHEFYEEVLGAKRGEMVSRCYEGTRGGNAHPCGIVGDYLFVLRGGEDSFRHAFSVSQTRFAELQDYLRVNEIDFEGPVSHPEKGPLGESIYFRDAGGNFFEVCWRRDEDRQYNAVRLAEA
jgi:catechol 2,3-dioxygenase-like lactoylglutathione lyase family enzyme